MIASGAAMDIIEANRRIEPVRREFQGRLYKWSLRDAQREFRDGFPFLRRIKSPLATAFVALVSKLPEETKGKLCAALVKRAHAQALPQVGERLEQSEEGLLAEYWVWIDRELTPLTRASVLKGFESEMAAPGLPSSISILRRELEKLLAEKLKSVLGVSREPWGGKGVWRYRSHLSNWKMDTYLDLGGKLQLRYHHVVLARDHVPISPPIISIMSWMGIGEASWSGMGVSEASDAVDCLADLCSHFLNALPEILEGLYPGLNSLNK